MGESQSRYSIVERLTQHKLDIMGVKSDLKEELKHKQQKIEELKKDLDNWNKDVEEDVRRKKREQEKAIDKSKQDYDNTKERLVEKEKMYEEKIKAIDEALHSIEEISKNSPNLQS
ncbi:MAG: hypothetical protein V2A62_01290 [Candidatus Woesearchaeota archaeon]